MAITSPKRAKESKMEAARGWTPRPILSPELMEDLPLEEVYVGVLKQKKDISTAIQRISSILPGFNHLKRCSSNRLLLAPLSSSESSRDTEKSSDENYTSEERLKTLLTDRGFNLSLLENHFQILKVPARAAKTKAQAAKASKIWPLNFHPDPNVESLLDGSIFTEHQLELIERYMNVSIEAAKLESIGNESCDGSAVIVDPEDGRILAVASSKINQHPMWHAAMLAIDLVAKLHGGGAWKLHESLERTEPEKSLSTDVKEDEDYARRERRIKRRYVEEAPLCYPESLSRIDLPKQEPLKTNIVRRGRNNNGCSKGIEAEQSEAGCADKCGPYLCTGYWTFLFREPCPLCAMALVHSRVSRIYYGVANRNTGVLGSRTVLHAVPGLNHRYQVWGGILEQECQRVSQEIERRDID